MRHTLSRTLPLQTPQKVLASTLALAFATLPAHTWAADNEAKLETIRVTAPKKINRKTQEVTGLGKVVKTAEQLDKEQVLNIRDLVRYDPGISVVEQGRGGSSGFSIRGVDKNRVQVSVDGIAQAQSYADTTSRSGGSGSMNEIEFENVSTVEINKGSNSVEAGSGSLGGSVSYHTKTVGDFITEGKNWGLNSKTAYSSKDSRFAQTLGGGFSFKGFEGLLQYTHRQGREISIHPDAGRTTHAFYRRNAYEDKYDLRYEPNRLTDNLFRFEDCNGSGCIKHKASLTRTDLWEPSSRTQPYTPEEERQRRELMRHTKETVTAEQYTGPNRIKPNPMEYQSGSWLARLGYHFSPEHYAGWVMEHTRQQYDSRDMRHPTYYTTDINLDAFGRTPIYIGTPPAGFQEGNNSNGIWRDDPREGYANLLWSRARFQEEQHRKHRQGVNYRYKPADSAWADSVDINLDRQNIKLDTATLYAACAPYGDLSTTLNCMPTLDKPGSYLSREQVQYQEKHVLFNTKWQKKWQWGWSKHDVQLAAGYNRFDSKFDKYLENTAVYKNQESTGSKETVIIDGKPHQVEIWRDLGNVMNTERPCTDWSIDTCTRLPIKGQNHYLALRNNMSLGRYVDLGLGLRFDRHRFRSDDVAIHNKNYTNRSWNVGLVLKPHPKWAVSYRMSNGFRVPSFQELYGYNVPGIPRDGKYHYIADLEPEKSFNREVGLTFKGDFGNVELSAFNSRYRDLIAYAVTIPDQNAYMKIGNFNVQNADLQGINLRSSIDLNGFWGKLPEGLSLHLAYNRIRAKRLFNNKQYPFFYVSDYPLETIQPSRYVLGLNYDAPSEKWGISANWTHSRGKNPQELISKVDYGDGKERRLASTQAATKPWTTLDMVGYWKPWKHATLRAGLYNALNHRYLMWETVRQSSRNSLSQQSVPGDDYAQFAAPGRNFTLGFEMKF